MYIFLHTIHKTIWLKSAIFLHCLPLYTYKIMYLQLLQSLKKKFYWIVEFHFSSLYSYLNGMHFLNTSSPLHKTMRRMGIMLVDTYNGWIHDMKSLEINHWHTTNMKVPYKIILIYKFTLSNKDWVVCKRREGGFKELHCSGIGAEEDLVRGSLYW